MELHTIVWRFSGSKNPHETKFAGSHELAVRLVRQQVQAVVLGQLVQPHQLFRGEHAPGRDSAGR